jgi:glycerophosphoryl diester phosphodiesterase
VDWRARGIGLRVGGHRGASAVAPENTYAAFERAVQDGAVYTETDIRATSDGALVLVHLDVGPSSIRALVPAGQGIRLKAGDDVAVRVEPAYLHLFDAESGRRVEFDAAGARHLDESVEGGSGLAS